MAVPRDLARRRTSPVEFWFGLFLVLFSGQFLSNLPLILEHRTWQLQFGAFGLTLTGITLFVAGGYVLQSGLEERRTHLALAVAALAFGLMGLYPNIVYGNPFALVVGLPGGLIVLFGLLGGLVLAYAAVWFARAVFAEAGLDQVRRMGLVFLAAVALERGVIQFLRTLVQVLAEPGTLRAWAVFSWVAFAGRFLPVLVRGLAAAMILWVVWAAVGRDFGLPAREQPRRLLVGVAGLAIALWASADLFYAGALWAAWAVPFTPDPPLLFKVRTSALILLPALPLLALADAVRREGLLLTSRPGRAR
ncbi:MAG: hypothetical protein AB1645_07155 [Bacillota bacterium]